MKYRAGNFLLLNNGKTVYVVEVDEKAKKYKVTEENAPDKIFSISESSVYMLVT